MVWLQRHLVLEEGQGPIWTHSPAKWVPSFPAGSWRKPSDRLVPHLRQLLPSWPPLEELSSGFRKGLTELNPVTYPASPSPTPRRQTSEYKAQCLLKAHMGSLAGSRASRKGPTR